MTGVRKRRRVWIAALAVAGCAITALVVTVLPDGPKRHQAERFAFSYPSGWSRLEGLRFPMAEDLQGAHGVGRHVVGIDRDNFVNVYAVDIPVAIDRANVRDVVASEREAFIATASQLGTVHIRQEPSLVGDERLPAIRFRVLYDNPRGVEVTSTITQLYDGATEYIVACEADAAAGAEVARGCRMVLETFEPLQVGSEP